MKVTSLRNEFTFWKYEETMESSGKPRRAGHFICCRLWRQEGMMLCTELHGGVVRGRWTVVAQETPCAFQPGRNTTVCGPASCYLAMCFNWFPDGEEIADGVNHSTVFCSANALRCCHEALAKSTPFQASQAPPGPACMQQRLRDCAGGARAEDDCGGGAPESTAGLGVVQFRSVDARLWILQPKRIDCLH
jgi:hypothetical protein